MKFAPRAPLVLIALLVAAPPAGASDPDRPVTGIAWTGAAGIPRTVAEIMAAPKLGAPGAATPQSPGRDGIWHDRRERPQAPDAADAARWPPEPVVHDAASGAARTQATAGPMVPGVSFTGATLAGVFPTFSFPADAMGAAGPTQYVVFVNGRIVSFNKLSGLPDGVVNAVPDAFFANVSDGSPTVHPRIRYDRLSGRWFLAIVTTSTPNRVLIAVSDAASAGVISASTVFTQFFFPIDATPPTISTSCFADDPTLGIDAKALYIGTANFCGATPTFDSCDGFVVRKSSVLAGGPIVVFALRGLLPNPFADGPVVPQGVDQYDPAANEGYFIGVSNLLFGRLMLRRVATPGAIPTVSANIAIPVPSTSFPLSVPHLGNTAGEDGHLSATDDRLFAAHLRNGRLWTAHNIAVNHTGTTSGARTRNAARWYEIAGVGSPATPSLLQAGTIFAASAENTTDQPHYFYPSVMVSGQGHVLVGMSTAGANDRIDATTAGRLAGDPPGVMSAPVRYTGSTTAYNPPGDPGGPQGRRWGEYSYTALDPVDDMSVWTIQMFCDATDSYGCRVLKLLAPPPAVPASAEEVGANLPSVLTTVTGVSTGGSGFYDPGPDPGGGAPPFVHIAAYVTNEGVAGTPPTVNAVTYVDPTHVVLDLNTVHATPSLGAEGYTVTIVNPDGQTATGTWILRVGESVGVGDGPRDGFGLGPVYPNPGSAPIRVDFRLGQGARVRLAVLDLSGREAAVLVDGTLPAGSHQARWDGTVAGRPVPAGIYFVRYEAAGRDWVRRFVRLR